MICPRCDNEIEYGAPKCRHCGLSFRYKEPVQSKAKRSTAAILSILLGSAGVHNFYTGYFLRGVIRLIITLFFCAVFVSPQIMSLVSEGRLNISFDLMGILGLVSLLCFIVSYALSLIEFTHYAMGDTETDAKGYKLQ